MALPFRKTCAEAARYEKDPSTIAAAVRVDVKGRLVLSTSYTPDPDGDDAYHSAAVMVRSGTVHAFDVTVLPPDMLTKEVP
jgi:hypothetical protein